MGGRPFVLDAMIEIPVLDMNGKTVGKETLDPEALGGTVRIDLLKQAIVAYRANLRQGTSATRSRGMVAGSTRKIYRQKGTGRARMGPIRNPVRRGGGVAFAKVPRDHRQKLPRQMRRLARNSAVLAKATSGNAVIVKGMKFDQPKTATFVKMLKACGVPHGAVVAVGAVDPNLALSARNLQDAAVRLVWELNAYEVLRARKLIMTPEALKSLIEDPSTAGRPQTA